MLPYTGTYAALGNAIENGFKLYVAGAGRQARRPRDRVLQGRRRIRAVEGHRQRQQADQARQRRRAGRHRALRRRDGDGQGGARTTTRCSIIPNAGADAVTGPMCAPNIFRTSFSNWQPGYAMGEVAGQKGNKTGGDDHLEVRRRRRVGRGLQGRLREGRRQGRQGADAAVPERRVPGAADRDRGAEARRGLRVLRRRRRGQVRQGLRGGGPQQDDPARTARASSPTARSRRRATRRRAC